MRETCNGWFNNGKNSYAKKIGENRYDVIRIEESDNGYYVEFYDRVENINVTEELLNQNGGTYTEYAKLPTDIEQVTYLAFCAFNCTSDVFCENEAEVKELLVENNVIHPEESIQIY